MADESDADDGAMFRFWAFVAAQRARRGVNDHRFDEDVLRTVEGIREAVQAFQDAEG